MHKNKSAKAILAESSGFHETYDSIDAGIFLFTDVFIDKSSTGVDWDMACNKYFNDAYCINSFCKDFEIKYEII